MTDAEKIARLESVLGTLISWLIIDLGTGGVEQLLHMLTSEPDK